jgi:hypothetical protein
VEFWLTQWFDQRKTFSHRRSNFPLDRVGNRTVVQEWAGELQTYQMVTFGVCDSYGFGMQISRSLSQCAAGREGCAGDFQRNLCGERQSASYSN